MKLALLGCDSEVLDLVRAAVADGHVVACLCDPGAALPALKAILPDARTVDDWDALLAEGAADAVIVARGEDAERRLEQLRRITQSGMPALVAHPFHLSMLAYLEIDMIRRDVGGLVLPCLPERTHPAIARLVELAAAEGPIGRLEQATLERSTPRRDRSGVLGQFARDVDLLRAVCGELTKVSSLAPPEASSRYANLGVQLSGAGGTLARWSAAPSAVAGARLTLRGERGKAALQWADSGSWRLEIENDGRDGPVEFPEWNRSKAAIDVFSRALAGGVVRPDWTDAARTVELVDAVERSLARGRTIELHEEEISEQATFKGVMTSLGCGLLVLGLVSLVIAAVAAKLGVTWAGYWLYVLCGVFGLFLLLQSLKLVFPRSSTGPTSTTESPSRSNI
jgi:predicted dehydrogenase